MRTIEQIKEYQSKYRKEHKAQAKDYMDVYSKKYYKENKERLKPIRKKWEEANKDKRKEIINKHIINNIETINKNRKKPNRRFLSTKYSAKKRNKEFVISRDEFIEIISRPCIYCGDDKEIGIDRVDNNIGYTFENSAPCCSMCNYMKNDYSVEEFKLQIIKIYKNL